jgi:hypothetical protein
MLAVSSFGIGIGLSLPVTQAEASRTLGVQKSRKVQKKRVKKDAPQQKVLRNILNTSLIDDAKDTFQVKQVQQLIDRAVAAPSEHRRQADLEEPVELQESYVKADLPIVSQFDGLTLNLGQIGDVVKPTKGVQLENMSLEQIFAVDDAIEKRAQ